jgi:hypothetical protein
MDLIEKRDVKLAPGGSLPQIHLRVTSLVEAVYRLVLRTPVAHPLARPGETFKRGDLGDDPVRFPDDHIVNFNDGVLASGQDLNGCTLSALVSFAAPSDEPSSKVDLAVYLTQDGKYVPNGTAAYAASFNDLGSVLIRFRLTA